MAATLLASFPNSRIKPRPARTQGSTQIATVATGGASLVLAANLNRTNALIRNLSPTATIWYGYDSSIDDTPGAQGGFAILPYDTANIDDPGNIYIYQNSGASVNISIDEGEG